MATTLEPEFKKNKIIPPLADMIRSMPEERQLILLKYLLNKKTTSHILKLVEDLSIEQQTILLKQLEENRSDTAGLKERELSLRESIRRPCLVAVNYEIEDRSLKNFIVDISTMGALIETGESFAVGQDVRMAFTLPSADASIKVNGEILWNSHQGIGVQFRDLTQAQKEMIVSFMGKE